MKNRFIWIIPVTLTHVFNLQKYVIRLLSPIMQYILTDQKDMTLFSLQIVCVNNQFTTMHTHTLCTSPPGKCHKLHSVLMDCNTSCLMFTIFLYIISPWSLWTNGHLNKAEWSHNLYTTLEYYYGIEDLTDIQWP
jgi:hypothetical protein